MLGGQQVVALAVGGVASIVLARTLKPSGFGTYSVLSVSISLAVLVATFGLDIHLISELGPRRGDQQPFGSAFRLCLEITLLLCIPAAGLVAALTQGAIRVASLLAVAELMLTPFLLARSVLVTRMQQGRLAGAGIVNRLCLLLGVAFIATVHVSPPLVWMMLASFFAVAVEALILGRLVGAPPGWVHRLGPSRKPLLAACWPVVAGSLAGVAYNRLDQLLLAGFRGQTEVGRYAVAVNLATLLGVISGVVAGATTPGVIEACRNRDVETAQRAVEDMALLMFVIGGLGISVVAGAGGDIIEHLFGRGYGNEHAIVAVLAFAEVWVFVGTALAAVIVAIDRRRALFAAAIVGLVVNVALNLILLATYGAIAAAWVSLASYAIVCFVALLLVPHARRLAQPLLGVTVAYTAAALVGAAAGTITPGLVPSICVSALVYLTICALFFRRHLARLRGRVGSPRLRRA
jgi:PST family polysaccharide transporter